MTGVQLQRVKVGSRDLDLYGSQCILSIFLAKVICAVFCV